MATFGASHGPGYRARPKLANAEIRLTRNHCEITWKEKLFECCVQNVTPFRESATIAEALEKAAWAHAARRFVTQLVSKAEINGVDLNSVGTENDLRFVSRETPNRPSAEHETSPV